MHPIIGFLFWKKKDFVLILMDPVQADILRKFGGKVICIDATHGIGYDFLLFSILVLDEYPSRISDLIHDNQSKRYRSFKVFF